MTTKSHRDLLGPHRTWTSFHVILTREQGLAGTETVSIKPLVIIELGGQNFYPKSGLATTEPI